MTTSQNRLFAKTGREYQDAGQAVGMGHAQLRVDLAASEEVLMLNAMILHISLRGNRTKSSLSSSLVLNTEPPSVGLPYSYVV